MACRGLRLRNVTAALSLGLRPARATTSPAQKTKKRPPRWGPGVRLSPRILQAAYTSVNRIYKHDFAMLKPHLARLPLLAPDRLGQLDPEGGDAWAIQREYMAWRRAQGLEPSPDRLNRWEQAWDLLGENAPYDERK